MNEDIKKEIVSIGEEIREEIDELIEKHKESLIAGIEVIMAITMEKIEDIEYYLEEEHKEDFIAEVEEIMTTTMDEIRGNIEYYLEEELSSYISIIIGRVLREYMVKKGLIEEIKWNGLV